MIVYFVKKTGFNCIYHYALKKVERLKQFMRRKKGLYIDHFTELRLLDLKIFTNYQNKFSYPAPLFII